jgi:DnaK suppressor protein
MTKSEIRRIAELLKEKRREIGKTLLNRDEIAIQQVPDELDQTQLTVERELALSRLNRDYSILQSLDAALRRIEDRTYGICIHCDEEISPKRLHAVPWTPLCLGCQEQFDQRHVRTGPELMPSAEQIF